MAAIDSELIGLLPNLRAYARFLTGNRHDADDLVQDTVVRLLGAADRFVPGTNFKAWAFTVLRNRFLNEFVAKRRPTCALEDVADQFLSLAPVQTHQMEMGDLAREFSRLPEEYRSVLALAVGEQLSYEEIAGILQCAVGTVKSRVHRARAALQRRLKAAYAPSWDVEAPVERGCTVRGHPVPSEVD
jgi:RNA polymerase sigma-70 factor (ECF subfamily)